MFKRAIELKRLACALHLTGDLNEFKNNLRVQPNREYPCKEVRDACNMVS